MSKGISKLVFVILLICLLLCSCNYFPPASDQSENVEEDMGYDYYAINMVEDFPLPDNLADGEGTLAKVVLLLGQSNATGCSLTSYLEKGVEKEKYSEFQAGYDNVLINFFIDNGRYTSSGEFVPTNLNCAAGEGCFGPELGMAEQLSAVFPEEKIFILKFTMSGYSLNYHWLYGGERASIYNACLDYVNTYMDYLLSKGYDAKISAICWMQGESDTTHYKADRYYTNTEKFVSYLRNDFSKYASDDGIYFIDAGISASPYCEPAYGKINEAKKEYAETSPLNIYFPTIEAGLTTLYEPESEPDLGHYDAMSELQLGRMFGSELVKVLKNQKQ